MREALLGLLNDPRPDNAPPPKRWEYIVVGLAVVLGFVEAAFEPLVEWRPVAAVLVVVVLPFLLVRRQRPLLAVAVPFTVQGVMDALTARYAEDSTQVGVTFLAGLVLVFALARWGAGREIAIGMCIVVAAALLSEAPDDRNALLFAVVSSTLWLFVAAVGVMVRLRSGSRAREVASARMAEREQLARELHDTVAHYVSAIAIQAQAGKLMADRDPSAAASTLGPIEDAASQTLAEMRRLVAVLRDGETVDMRPQAALEDLSELTEDDRAGPAVELTIRGDRGALGPALEASIYRIAQESVTNATRHARNATLVAIEVDIGRTSVTVTVTDDGDPVGAAAGRAHGYGLVGMRERAEILGGTFESGPVAPRGWRVHATLPFEGVR